ncbi:unnamed protein product [Notodromas monacha]|uniref:HRDC domain-containing protein n=1 Tax=Notodromas monacha TaxID=399045 RepID=A0A7R9BJ99_9CRUS|nr:unnamed protein product [Notodromas monacha]CAG0916240.1 unnamed protein product [Notodromas monacha]
MKSLIFGVEGWSGREQPSGGGAWNPRSKDLFQFMQTPNLLKWEEQIVPCTRGDGESTGGAPSVGNHVKMFGDILRVATKPVLQCVSGIDFSDDIFMSSSIYTHTDTLLCHDDDLEERRLAFMFYLTPPEWTEEAGGQLDLFECTDEDPVMSLDALEASVFFSSPTSTEDDDDETYDGPGGFVSYVHRFETDEMLRISPARNTLSLVYRTSDVLRFTKHSFFYTFCVAFLFPSCAMSDGTMNDADDMEAHCSEVLRKAKALIQASQKLPKPDSSEWEYYAGFPDFVKTLHVECNVLLSTMNMLMSHHNACSSDIRTPYADLDKYEIISTFASSVIDDTIECLTTADKALVRSKFASKEEEKKAKTITKTPSPAVHRRSMSMIKPQLFFSKKPNNDPKGEFVPILTSKPHSVIPLQDSLVKITDDDGQVKYRHPYEAELSCWEPKKNDLSGSQLSDEERKKLLVDIDETAFEYVDDASRVPEIVSELKEHSIVGFDVEHHNYRSFQGITCLLQISVTGKDYVIDTIKLRDHLQPLNEVFTHPRILKVAHGANSDIIWLQRDLGIYIVNLFDTHEAAVLLDMPRRGLAALLSTYCGIEAEKQYQTADWRVRPLSEELIRYARRDTRFLEYLYWTLREALIDAGNASRNLLRAVFERSREICLLTYEKPEVFGQAYAMLESKCKAVFDVRQMSALKNLYEWRDTIARREDESVHYVLPTHMLQKIAENLPREMQAIFLCCNPTPQLVKVNLLGIHEIVLRARQIAIDTAFEKRKRQSGTEDDEVPETLNDTLSKLTIRRNTPVLFHAAPLKCRLSLEKSVCDRWNSPPCLLDENPATGQLLLNESYTESPRTAQVKEVQNREAVNNDRQMPRLLTPFQRYMAILPLTRGDLAHADGELSVKVAKLRDRLAKINDASLAAESQEKRNEEDLEILEPEKVADLSKIYGPGSKKFGAKGVKTEFGDPSLISEEQETDHVAVVREETGVRIHVRRGKKRKSYVKTEGVEATELKTSPVVVGPSDGSEESVPPAKSPRIDDFSVFDEKKSRKTDGVDSQPVHLFKKGKKAGKEVKRRGNELPVFFSWGWTFSLSATRPPKLFRVRTITMVSVQVEFRRVWHRVSSLSDLSFTCMARMFVGLVFCTACIALVLLDAKILADAGEKVETAEGEDPSAEKTLVYHSEQTFAVLKVGPANELHNCSLIEAIEEEEIARTLADLLLNHVVQPISFDDMLNMMTACRNLSVEKLSKERVTPASVTTTKSPVRPLVIREAIMRGPLTLIRGILPGTKWCGNGDIAETYQDLGEEWDIDTCCREHDHCPVKVRAFGSRYGYFNAGVYTKSHCDCDSRFNACLKSVNTSISNILGQTYFDVLRVQCVMHHDRMENGTLTVKDGETMRYVTTRNGVSETANNGEVSNRIWLFGK